MKKSSKIEIYDSGRDSWQLYDIIVDTEENIFDVYINKSTAMSFNLKGLKETFATKFENYNFPDVESKKVVIMGILGTK